MMENHLHIMNILLCTVLMIKLQGIDLNSLITLLNTQNLSKCRVGDSYRIFRTEFNGDLPFSLSGHCHYKIFCQGDILHDVQTRSIYEDSKDFVDSKLKFPEREIIQKYDELRKQYGKLSDDQMRQFLNQNFYNPGDIQHMGLDNWSPPDYRINPSIVENIRDTAYKKFALSLNARWVELAAKVNQDVRDNPDRYSLIYLPNGFIKAGGRFREMYYWDSYWVIRGLLLCDMYETVRGIIENMIHMVDLYGHMPNGSRKYYLQRSQPPLLIQMAACYHSVTKDDDFIRKNLQNFETEFQFWYINRTIDVHKNGRVYRMARYNAVSCTPRPESYREDYNYSRALPESEKKRFFTGIKSGAESGWDFSSRHIRAPDDSNNASLLYIETQSFIYVDLNCILHANAVVLSEWFRYFGNEVQASRYRTIANNLQDAIENVLWNEEVGVWLDWDLKAGKSRNYFFPSNLTPLWTSSYNKLKVGLVEKVMVYLLKNGIIGLDLTTPYWAVPTSLKKTGEQWDFPNGWAPLQAIVIQGLERTGHPMARYTAFNMAQNWIKTTYAGFQANGTMFEKYSAIELGTSGGGGEYTVQKGFGWTNGFILEIFNTWGRYLDSRQT